MHLPYRQFAHATSERRIQQTVLLAAERALEEVMDLLFLEGDDPMTNGDRGAIREVIKGLERARGRIADAQYRMVQEHDR
jgi:hypothetical protein